MLGLPRNSVKMSSREHKDELINTLLDFGKRLKNVTLKSLKIIRYV
jgi:hypothetical protein